MIFERFEMSGFDVGGDTIAAPDNYPSKGTGELGAFSTTARATSSGSASRSARAPHGGSAARPTSTSLPERSSGLAASEASCECCAVAGGRPVSGGSLFDADAEFLEAEPHPAFDDSGG